MRGASAFLATARGGTARVTAALCLLGAVVLTPAVSAAGEGQAPARVVSVNLCTDQLALLLAAPGQLRSVSWLAADPRSSVMPEAAAGLHLNHGGAEEVFAQQPDLVLASAWTRRETLSLLRRLGLRVEEIPPVQSLEEIPDALIRTAQLLGRAAEGERLAAEFRRDLAALSRPPGQEVAAVWQAGGYTSGRGTLTSSVLQAAGLQNLAERAGFGGGGYLPLEVLVLAEPDLLITPEPWPGASQAEDLLRHPALRRGADARRPALVQTADWVCGLPQILRVVAALTAAQVAEHPAPGAVTGGHD